MTTPLSPQARKISFPVDAVFRSAIQDCDNYELWRILNLENHEVDLDQKNHSGLTALHQSVLNNNVDAVKMLLCNEAGVNIPDVHGYTPLHTAAACGYIQVVSLLVIFGADVFLLTEEGDLAVDLAKDSNTASILTHQMIRRLYRANYTHSWIMYHLRKFLGALFKLLLLSINWSFVFIRDISSKIFETKNVRLKDDVFASEQRDESLSNSSSHAKSD